MCRQCGAESFRINATCISQSPKLNTGSKSKSGQKTVLMQVCYSQKARVVMKWLTTGGRAFYGLQMNGFCNKEKAFATETGQSSKSRGYNVCLLGKNHFQLFTGYRKPAHLSFSL